MIRVSGTLTSILEVKPMFRTSLKDAVNVSETLEEIKEPEEVEERVKGLR